jgi:hypothetical protein
VQACPEDCRGALASEVLPTGPGGHVLDSHLSSEVRRLGERITLLPARDDCAQDAFTGLRMLASLPRITELFRSRDDVALLHALQWEKDHYTREGKDLAPHPVKYQKAW